MIMRALVSQGTKKPPKRAASVNQLFKTLADSADVVMTLDPFYAVNTV
jgi:hypothetical protein